MKLGHGPGAKTRAPQGGGEAQLLSIQYLRALAAVAVVVFHCGARFGFGFPSGAAGVDLFFVISGFIMWTITATQPAAPSLFLWHRLVRIAPMYSVATLMAAVQLHPPVGPTVLSLLYVPYYDATGHIFPVEVQGWTLNYEMFFYLVFAGSLFLAQADRPWAILTVFLILISAGLAIEGRSAPFRTYTDTLLLEFLGGVFIGRAFERGWRPPARGSVALIISGVALFIAERLAHLYNEPFRFLIWGGPAALVLTGAVGLERRGGLRAWPLLRTFGNASFSLYLFHGYFLGGVRRVLHTVPAWVAALSAVAATLAGSVAIYLMVEKPLSERLRGKRRDRAVAAPPDAQSNTPKVRR